MELFRGKTIFSQKFDKGTINVMKIWKNYIFLGLDNGNLIVFEYYYEKIDKNSIFKLGF